LSRRKKEGICHICGTEGPLSKEHIPPKKAFNNCTVFLHRFTEIRDTGVTKWQKEQRQGGNYAYVLCEKCNNDTGSWYADEYVKFAHALAPLSSTERVGHRVGIVFRKLKPLQVTKQAIAIMCTTCGPDFSKKHPHLKKFLLSKHKRGLPHHLHLFAYLRCQPGMRTSGIAGQLDLRGNNKVVAEFSCWPVGWILAFDDHRDILAAEVTHWASCEFDESQQVQIQMPCHWTATKYPMDFRSPAQVERQAEQSQKHYKERKR